MFIKTVKSPTMKKTKVYLVEGYRDVSGKIKHRKIDCYGFLEDLQAQDPNILEKLREKAKNIESSHVEITVNLNDKQLDECPPDNFGYFFIEGVYKYLELTDFFEHIKKICKFKFPLNDIVKMLTILRILNPDSKKSSFADCKYYFGLPRSYNLSDIYRSLDYISDYKKELQHHLQTVISSQQNRDTSLLYYDVTNYSFEIDYNDEDIVDEDGKIIKEGLRKKGPAKNYKPSPIVSMGLFMDNNGIPITYKLFPGNRNDHKTLISCFNNVKEEFKADKLIFVTDKGLNSSENVDYILNGKNGYIISQSVRKASDELQKWVLSQEEYEFNKDKTFKKKSMIHTREIKYTIEDEEGKKNKICKTVKEKVICFWSKNYADRIHQATLPIKEAALYYVKNPKLYTKYTKKGCKKYIIEHYLDPKTKQKTKVIQSLEFDSKKFDYDRSLDGYYMIVTSQLELSDSEIIEKYRGLWRIEDTFKVTKTDLEGRPVYVQTQEHIEAHFAICFIALLIIRLLQQRLGYKDTDNKPFFWSTEQVISALKSAVVTDLHSKGIVKINGSKEFTELNKAFNVYLQGGRFSKVEYLKRYRNNILNLF